MDAVLPRLYGKLRVLDPDTVLSRQTVLFCRNRKLTARHAQIVLGDDTVPCRCVNLQTAAAVDRQITCRKDHGIHVILVRFRITAAVFQHVFRFRRKRQKYLVRVFDINRRSRLIADRHAIQNKLHLRALPRIHDHRMILHASPQKISALLRDHDVLRAKRDHLTFRFRVFAGKVSLRKQLLRRHKRLYRRKVFLRSLRHALLRKRLLYLPASAFLSAAGKEQRKQSCRQQSPHTALSFSCFKSSFSHIPFHIFFHIFYVFFPKSAFCGFFRIRSHFPVQPYTEAFFLLLRQTIFVIFCSRVF